MVHHRNLIVLAVVAFILIFSITSPQAEPPAKPGNPGLPGCLAEIDHLQQIVANQQATIGALEEQINALQALCGYTCNLVTNGSFEDGYLDPAHLHWRTLYAGDTTGIPGWTVVTGSIDYIGTFWNAANGSRSIDLSGYGPGLISQAIPTVIGTQYLVKFSMAGNPSPSGVTQMQVGAGTSIHSFFDVFSAVVAFDRTGKSATDMGWIDMSFTFTAISATTYLQFLSLDPTDCGPALDNVRAYGVP